VDSPGRPEASKLKWRRVPPVELDRRVSKKRHARIENLRPEESQPILCLALQGAFSRAPYRRMNPESEFVDERRRKKGPSQLTAAVNQQETINTPIESPALHSEGTLIPDSWKCALLRSVYRWTRRTAKTHRSGLIQQASAGSPGRRPRLRHGRANEVALALRQRVDDQLVAVLEEPKTSSSGNESSRVTVIQ
jgi:hypothetical protein